MEKSNRCKFVFLIEKGEKCRLLGAISVMKVYEVNYMEEKNNSPFEVLRKKSIIEILDGDTAFGEIDEITISMPYLSGPDIVGISQVFELQGTYSWQGALSRWSYLDNLLQHGIFTNQINNILLYLFSKKQFTEKLKGNSPEQIERFYNHIVQTVIEQINGILYFNGNKLIFTNQTFSVIPLTSTIEITTPQVKNINHEYIKDISKRALSDVVNGNYDSAITKSRTLIEEVFCYVIEQKNALPSDSGDIGKLYKQVKDLYNMHTDKNNDKRINKLLSGLESIVSAIAEMRNKGSDAHGVGSKRFKIAEYHARLLVNSAMTMAEFIISVGNNAM